MEYLIEAALVAAIYYATVALLDRGLEMQLPRRGNWIISPTVVLAGLAIPLCWCAAGLTGMEGLSLSEEVLLLILLWGMAALTVTDLSKKLIPNRFLLLLCLLWAGVVCLTIILEINTGMEIAMRSIAGSLIAAAIFLLCYLLSRKQLGAGDVKLAFVMGLYLGGERILPALLYGALLSCAVSVLLLLRKKITLKDGIPLVPFLYVGVLLTIWRIG